MKKILNYIKRIILSSYIFDVAFAVGLLIILLLEIRKCIQIDINYNIAIDIVIALFPAVITLISISLQMQTEKIRGITFKEFNKLRSPMCFKLLHMCLAFVAVFVLETLFILFDLRICLLALDTISIVYSVLFLIQEIPFLMRSDKRIDRILKRTANKDINPNQDRRSSSYKAMIWTVAKNGAKDSFYRWKQCDKNKNSILLSNILNFEISYYDEYNKHYSPELKENIFDYADIDLIKAIDNSLQDISDLLDDKDVFCLKKIYKDADGVFLIIRLTYLIKQVSTNCKIDIKQRLVSLADKFYLTQIKDISEIGTIYRYMILMSISTLKSGNTWFVETLRDQSYGFYFFDIEVDQLSYLLSAYMCFLLSSTICSEISKTNIKSFLKQKEQGLNKRNICWKEKLKDSIRNLNSGKVFLKGFRRLLDIKESVGDSYYDIFPEYGEVYSIDDSTNFSTELIMDYLLQILLFNYFHDVGEDDINSFIDSLSENDRDTFIRMFETRWKNSGNDNSLLFYYFVFDTLPNRNYLNKEIYDCINKYVDIHNHIQYQSDKSNIIDDETIHKIKNNMDKNLPNEFASVALNDKGLTMSNNKYYYLLKLEGPDVEQLYNYYVKIIKNGLENDVFQTVEESVVTTKIIDSEYDSKTIDDIIDFNPDFASNLLRISYQSNDEQRGKISGIKEFKDFRLPRDLFFMSDSIKVKFEYCKNDSQPRRLTDKEINDIIDNDYSFINGYYRFNKYKGSDFGSFLVTREELFNILKDKIIYIQIVYKREIKVDKQKIRYYKFKY